MPEALVLGGSCWEQGWHTSSLFSVVWDHSGVPSPPPPRACLKAPWVAAMGAVALSAWLHSLQEGWAARLYHWRVKGRFTERQAPDLVLTRLLFVCPVSSMMQLLWKSVCELLPERGSCVFPPLSALLPMGVALRVFVYTLKLPPSPVIPGDVGVPSLSVPGAEKVGMEAFGKEP